MKKLLLSISLCVILTNCVSAEQKIIREQQRQEKIKTQCPKHIKDVQDGAITKGMTEKCLILSWGLPFQQNEVTSSRVGRLQQFIYSDTRVFIRNGKITSWRSK